MYRAEVSFSKALSLWPVIQEGSYKQLFLLFLLYGFKDLKPQTRGNCPCINCAVITSARCFLDWPRYPFIWSPVHHPAGQMARVLPVFHPLDKQAVGWWIPGQRPDGRGSSAEKALSVHCHCCSLLTCSAACSTEEGSGTFSYRLGDRLCACTHSLGCVAKHPPVLKQNTNSNHLRVQGSQTHEPVVHTNATLLFIC